MSVRTLCIVRFTCLSLGYTGHVSFGALHSFMSMPLGASMLRTSMSSKVAHVQLAWQQHCTNIATILELPCRCSSPSKQAHGQHGSDSCYKCNCWRRLWCHPQQSLESHHYLNGSPGWKGLAKVWGHIWYGQHWARAAVSQDINMGRHKVSYRSYILPVVLPLHCSWSWLVITNLLDCSQLMLSLFMRKYQQCLSRIVWGLIYTRLLWTLWNLRRIYHHCHDCSSDQSCWLVTACRCPFCSNTMCNIR